MADEEKEITTTTRTTLAMVGVVMKSTAMVTSLTVLFVLALAVTMVLLFCLNTDPNKYTVNLPVIVPFMVAAALATLVRVGATAAREKWGPSLLTWVLLAVSAALVTVVWVMVVAAYAESSVISPLLGRFERYSLYEFWAFNGATIGTLLVVTVKFVVLRWWRFG